MEAIQKNMQKDIILRSLQTLQRSLPADIEEALDETTRSGYKDLKTKVDTLLTNPSDEQLQKEHDAIVDGYQLLKTEPRLYQATSRS